jgi:hypothetical protein
MTVPVTVASGPQANTHIPLTRAIYDELLEALDELDRAFNVTAESANARRWLHYRWLVEQQSAQNKSPSGG